MPINSNEILTFGTFGGFLFSGIYHKFLIKSINFPFYVDYIQIFQFFRLFTTIHFLSLSFSYFTGVTLFLFTAPSAFLAPVAIAIRNPIHFGIHIFSKISTIVKRTTGILHIKMFREFHEWKAKHWRRSVRVHVIDVSWQEKNKKQIGGLNFHFR